MKSKISCWRFVRSLPMSIRPTAPRVGRTCVREGSSAVGRKQGATECVHMTALHDDPRVRRGMERQLQLRRRILADGARPIGWKLGLGTAAAMEQHGTTAPLVGFLTDRGVREPGAELSIGGWTKATA